MGEGKMENYFIVHGSFSSHIPIGLDGYMIF